MPFAVYFIKSLILTGSLQGTSANIRARTHFMKL